MRVRPQEEAAGQAAGRQQGRRQSRAADAEAQAALPRQFRRRRRLSHRCWALKHPNQPFGGPGRWRIAVMAWNCKLGKWMTLRQKTHRGELEAAVLAAKRAAEAAGGRGGILRINA